MRRFILALLLLAAAATPARAWLVQKTASSTPTYQVFMAATTSAVSASAATYMPIHASGIAFSADDKYTMFSAAGTLSTIRVKVNGTAPTGTQTWTVTVTKNGSDTALACTIGSGSSGVCTTSTNISFSANDYGSIKIQPANTPTVARIQIATLFQATTANETNVPTFGNVFPNSGTTNVEPLFNMSTPGNAVSRRFPAFPDGGTISHLYIQSNAPGTAASGKQYAYTVNKNNSGQTSTCTIADDATSCNDTTHSFSVSGPSGGTPGDDVVILGVPTGTPTAALTGIGLKWVPTTVATFPLMYGTTNSDSASATNYFPITGGNSGAVTAESQVQTRAIAMTITKIAVKLATAPGAGKSRAFVLRKGGSDTALTCTIADTATACVATGSISIADDDLLTTADVPTGTPATSTVSISYLATK